MTYTPTPYSKASKYATRGYDCIDVSLEIETEDDVEEVEFCFFFQVEQAEPDVGISENYIDDWFYAEGDGSPVPESVWIEIDKIDRKNADRTPVSKGMDSWHETNYFYALEG
ncbi:MAG: hypothetical protein ACRCYS_11490 [Beijerinckiaceae bacterium]